MDKSANKEWKLVLFVNIIDQCILAGRVFPLINSIKWFFGINYIYIFTMNASNEKGDVVCSRNKFDFIESWLMNFSHLWFFMNHFQYDNIKPFLHKCSQFNLISLWWTHLRLMKTDGFWCQKILLYKEINCG